MHTVGAWLRRLQRCLVPALALALAAGVPSAALSLDYHFRSPPKGTAIAVSAQVLSEQERAFIAALPELRVAVALRASQPYEVIGADGEVSGIHAEMLGALAQAFGLRIKPVVLPDWSSALAAVREKQADIVLTVGVTAERLQYLAFTLGATPLPGGLFARRGAEVDLTHARIALERDYQAHEHVRRQYPQATIVTVETTIDALRAVGTGQADAYLGSLLVASDLLAHDPVPGIELNRLHGYGTGYNHFGVRKDWAPLATILNKGMQSVRASGDSALTAALGAALPKGVSLRPPLALSDGESAVLAHTPVWRIGAVRGLALLNDIDANGLHSGIAAEYSEQVAGRLGVATQPVAFANVGAMLDGLRRGEIDLVPFLTRTAARDKEFSYSTPYVEMPYILVARSDGPLYWNLGSLRGKRLALALQHPLRELLAKSYPQIHVVDADNGTDAMDRVSRGEADAAVEVKLFANLRINADSDARLRSVAEVTELPAQFHFATRRNAAELLPLVDRALADLPAAERDRMLRRWVAVDLRPGFAWRRYLPLLVVVAAALLAIGGGTAWWMRRLNREVRQRRRSEELLNDIATTVPGVAFRYVIDAAGALQQHYFTPGAKAFLGIDLDPKRTLLAAIGPLLRPEHRAEAQAEETACLHSGERFKMTCAYRHPDGRERWLHAEAVQARRPQARAVWTGYVVDVSTERELQDRAARLARERHLMLASASHELRAPTHTLSLALQTLAATDLDAAQRGPLRIARDSAQTLGYLLDDVLDAARLDAQALVLHPRSVDLPALLAEIAASWQAVAQGKGLAFVNTVAADVPRSVELDPLRFKQILTNLLSNACKYTAAGQVSLRADMVVPDRLRVVVGDTGVGIEPAEQARLFQPYVTLDDPAVDAVGEHRSGLGLSICWRIAQLMGGAIALDSQRHAGSRFCFELPLQRALHDAGTEARRPAGSTIVVCDDDATSRMLMAQMLRRQGLSVVEAASAEEALAVWRRGGVCAVVTDLHMPGLGGQEMIRQLRAEEAGQSARTAVIICSGSELALNDDEPVATSYDAFLRKPVDVSLLADTLRGLHVAAPGAPA